MPHTAAARLALAVACAALLGACPRFSPNVDVTRGIVYGSGLVRDNPLFGDFERVPLRMDVLAPNDGPQELRPAVIVVHGGGFTEGSREDERQVELADALAAQGYVCFLIDYRLAGDYPPAPSDWANVLIYGNAIHAAFVDTKTAVRHVRANAAAYGVDPERIAVLGNSAGAFASAAAAVTESTEFAQDRDDLPQPVENAPGVDARVQAAVVLWGNGGLVLDAFTPDDPPMMILHGTEDRQLFTPLGAAEAMRDACVEQGIPHVFYPIPGAGHGAWEARVDGADLVDLTLDFLETYL
jgi:acetyl esterase/lipase